VSAITAEPIPAQDAPPRWRADLALAFVALLWGSTFVVVKSVLSDISTIYFLAIRFWVASLCMALLFIKPFRAAGAKAVWSGLRGGAVAGLFLWSGYILQTYGLKYTSAGKSGFITGLYIVLVPLIGASVYRKWPHISEIIGILIATAGMGLMLAPGESGFAFNMRQFRLDQFNFGDLVTIACAVAFAGQLVVLGYYARRERFEAVALGQILCAAVLSTVALSAEPPRVSWSPGVVFALALTGIFATAIAFAIQTWGQQYTSATRTALIFALEPVFALVTAVAFGGERLTAGAAGGGLLILTGILLVELKPLGRSRHPISSAP
jgi:drug/metabolite transporter (DMT)-like permease